MVRLGLLLIDSTRDSLAVIRKVMNLRGAPKGPSFGYLKPS